jgi:phospholipid/cholesterol/gamma-HCH transport system permease protein
MVASEKHGAACVLDFLKQPVGEFQDFLVLSGRALKNVFRAPHYWDDVFLQMDIIGVGGLSIVTLIGFFSGLVITMQMSRSLSTYGAVDQVGPIVMVILVRELGPVLTAVMVAGRTASGIASELGSMKVSEQIDAMRALGTDPIQKLVTPRMIATAVMLPLLTIMADLIGMVGGFLIAYFTLRLTPSQYWTPAYQTLEYNDVVQGLLKPFMFAFVVSLVGCYYGMQTTGGTQGVGRSTTQAVVVACVWIFVLDALLGRIFVHMG